MILLALLSPLVSAGFNEPLASKLFFMTSASYCSRKHLENWNCGKPCKQVPKLQDMAIFLNETSEISGYSGYLAETGEVYYIFRGTEPWSVKNWMEDINFIKTSYPYCNNGCQVHRGFYYAFQGISQQVLNAALRLKSKYPNAPIIMAGHSLGGALANHALVFLHSNGIKVNQFYTFGSPRVGDTAFFQYVHKVVLPGEKYRVTHNRDPVPHLPFLDWGFQHVSQEAFYDDILFIHKKVKLCNDSVNEDDTCSNKSLVDLSVDDHATYMGYNMALELVLCQ